MDNNFIVDMVKTSGMVNMEQAMNIYHLLMRVMLLNIPGHIVELGCHRGKTARIMQKVLDVLEIDREVHLYDSFEGLPGKRPEDGHTPFRAGQMSANPNAPKHLIAGEGFDEAHIFELFDEFKLRHPIIHRMWFNEITDSDIPSEIVFAHLDGDFYTSIMESLELVYPRLSSGGICIVDDYCDPVIVKPVFDSLGSLRKKNYRNLNVLNALPGVKKACDEFFADKPEGISQLYCGYQCHGYFTKL